MSIETPEKIHTAFKDRIKAIPSIAFHAFKQWRKSGPIPQSAVIAYFSILSLPGLLFLIIGFVDLFYERDIVNLMVDQQMSSVMGVETSTQIQKMILQIDKGNQPVLATIVGAITVLLAATGVFAHLQSSLNSIWEVKPKKRKLIARRLRTRLFSFGLILTLGLLLILSLLLTTLLALLRDWVISRWPDFMLVTFNILNNVTTFIFITILFASMFKFLPDVKIKYSDVWLGSIITSLLFLAGKSIISFYLIKAQPDSPFGAAGSIVLFMLWVSYSSMIVLYGAEFTRAYRDHFEGPATITPKEDAERTNKVPGELNEGKLPG